MGFFSALNKRRGGCLIKPHWWDKVRPYGSSDDFEWVCRRCSGIGSSASQSDPPPAYQGIENYYGEK